MAKEVIITYMYLVVFIFKLRLFGTFNPVVYFGIKRHMVLFPYNLAPLLTFFPSSTLALYDVIYII